MDSQPPDVVLQTLCTSPLAQTLEDLRRSQARLDKARVETTNSNHRMRLVLEERFVFLQSSISAAMVNVEGLLEFVREEV